MIRRYRFILCFVMALGLTFVSHGVYASKPTETKPTEKEVGSFVSQVSDKIINIITSDISEVDKEQMLSQLFDTYVDTNWMGQFVLGRYNRKLTDEELDNLMDMIDRNKDGMLNKEELMRIA